MTPAANEFAEIARRLAEIKAERTKTIAGEAEPVTNTYTNLVNDATTVWVSPTLNSADCGNTTNPIDGPYC